MSRVKFVAGAPSGLPHSVQAAGVVLGGVLAGASVALVCFSKAARILSELASGPAADAFAEVHDVFSEVAEIAEDDEDGPALGFVRSAR